MAERVMQVEITGVEDRKTLVAILHANGYTTRPVKIRKSTKGYGQGIEFWRENVTRENGVMPDEG